MKYMGSKSRLAKYIVPILQKIINDNNIKTYIEPSCGGANIIDKISCETRIGYDKSRTLIALLNQAKTDFSSIPENGNREWWDKAKAIYRNQSDEKMEEYLIGAIQFLGSFSNGGFPRGYAKNTKTRDCYNEAYKNLEKQAPLLNNIIFKSSEYQNIIIPDHSLVYCDPPYFGTTPYGYKEESQFDYEAFWNWVKEVSKTNIVVCSETTVPDDCNILWSGELKGKIGKNKESFVMQEKLVTYNNL